MLKTNRNHLAAMSVVSCVLWFLTGCGFDRSPTVLGPDVVTPKPVGSDHATPNGNGASPGANGSQAACGPSPRTRQSTRGAPAVPTPFRDNEAELDAEDQVGDGRTVMVDDVQLTRTDGFVTVCMLDSNRLLGSSPIARSTDDRPVRVRLDEPITTTTRLLVVLYADNGDGHFDWATDPRVSGDDDDVADLEVERLTYRVR